MTNKYRTLLSEVLPYEVPLFFDNVGFYEKLVSGDIDENYLKSSFRPNKPFSIPFHYDIKRNGNNGLRRLSIIHPLQQLEIVNFYQKYDALLAKNSIGSPFSLRHINDISKLHYNTLHELIVDYDKTEKELDDEEHDSRVYVAYFTYREIDRMYKFFKDMPLFRLEQKYLKMRKLDVAKCFYHIYTHSIAWAIEGKEFAKNNIGKECLATDFDMLMQHCNYNETNGIVVGPEVSRIFAEIIFRRIDFNVLETLKKQNIVFGKDYELRRYVDDMIVFAQNDLVLDRIEEVITKELEEYKLYLNSAKIENYTRPFGTPRSCAKQELLEEYKTLQSRIETSCNPPYKQALSFFRKFRTIASNHGISYSDLNRMTLSLLAKMVKNDDFGTENKLKSWLTVLDIAFYVFTLDMSATASLRLCRVILLAMQAFEKESAETRTIIEEKMRNEAHRFLSIHLNNANKDLTAIEVINPLLALKSINIDVCTRKIIIELFHLGTEKVLDCSHLNYFNICSLLLLIQNDVTYNDIKQALLLSIEKRYVNYGNDSWKLEAEMTLLLLDLITCPFITDNEKNNLLVKAHFANNTHNAGNKRTTIRGYKPRWFFDWNMNPTALDYYLKKKEYKPTYE